jgi:hypothetical protein
MGKKSSFGTNSWWHARMVHSNASDRNIDTFEDRKQDAYLKKLEESVKASPKKIENLRFRPKKNNRNNQSDLE